MEPHDLDLAEGTTAMKHSTPALKRHTFATSRLLEFTSEKELALQTGHPAEQWACVVAKELGDNAADAAEEAGVAPDISFTVTTTRGKGGITVTDNGPGIPADTVTKLLDFSVRVSSREAYVAPCRGAQGNALKTILMMPFVLGGDTAKPVIIEACGIQHSISISVDAVQQKPMVDHEQERSKKKNGTAITVPWPNVSLLTLRAQKQQFLQIVRTFALLNPHATIRIDWDGERTTYKAIDADFSKWGPSDPTPPCWYNAARFERLLAAYANEDGSRTIREFVSEFRGLSGSAKVAEVLDATNLARVTVGEMFSSDGKPSPRINRLLAAMHMQTSAVKPVDLGVIGKQNLMNRFEALGADLDSFQYKRVFSRKAELPYVIEVAFAYVPAERDPRVLMTGINFSPAIVNPFRQLGRGGEGLERVLAGQRVEAKDPVIVAVHFTCPVVTYLDRGKSAVALKGEAAESGLQVTAEPDEDPNFWRSEIFELYDGTPADALITAVKAVTQRWFKQIKAEERDSCAEARRAAVMRASRRVPQTVAAAQVMVEAYMRASANDTLPANARQIMYAARKVIEHLSERPLRDTYFTQTLLPDYIAEFQPAWANNVVYDDRGHFVEPHTGKMIGLGTLNVRDYLNAVRDPVCDEVFAAKVKTFGPMGRYCGIFFVEKEGFDPLFERMQLEQRYDLAFMSTKGLSVTAARLLVDQLCAKYNIPLFVLRDFDKSGFVGAGTFQKSNRRYTYENTFRVFDIGLRLEDVHDLIARFPDLGNLDTLAENTHDRGSAAARRANLEANGAKPEEIAFLVHDDGDTDDADAEEEDDVEDDGDGGDGKKRKSKKIKGRRVELNALPSDVLVDFVERKLQGFREKRILPRKVVPDVQVLAEAYRMFKREPHIQAAVAAEKGRLGSIPVPADLEFKVREYLAEHPEVPWDAAVAHLAKQG
jgi:DNA topoisomerase VI subunit B